MDVGCGGSGAAKRRRDRRLRGWHRHVKITVAMELATALHHSAQPAGPDRRRLNLLPLLADVPGKGGGRKRRWSRSGRTRRLRSNWPGGAQARAPGVVFPSLFPPLGRRRKKRIRKLLLQVVDVPVIINDEFQQSVHSASDSVLPQSAGQSRYVACPLLCDDRCQRMVQTEQKAVEVPQVLSRGCGPRGCWCARCCATTVGGGDGADNGGLSAVAVH